MARTLDFLFDAVPLPRPGPRHVPDLILLDLNLPKKNGVEVLEQVEADGWMQEIPVVVLATSDREENVARCYKVGANSYLTKPVQFDDYLKLVEEIQQYWLHVSKFPPKNKTIHEPPPYPS